MTERMIEDRIKKLSALEEQIAQLQEQADANVSVTLDVYTHLDFTKLQEKMEAVQENMMIG